MRNIVWTALAALALAVLPASAQSASGNAFPMKVFTVGVTGGTVAESASAITDAMKLELGRAGLIGSEGAYALAIKTVRLTAGEETFLVGAPKVDSGAKTITYTIAFTEEFRRTPPLDDVAKALVEDLKIRSEFAAMKAGGR